MVSWKGLVRRQGLGLCSGSQPVLWLWGSCLTSVGHRENLFQGVAEECVYLYRVFWEALLSFTMRLAYQYKVWIHLNFSSLLWCFHHIFLGIGREKGILALSHHLCHPLSSHPAPKSVTRDPDLSLQRAGRGWGQSKKPGGQDDSWLWNPLTVECSLPFSSTSSFWVSKVQMTDRGNEPLSLSIQINWYLHTYTHTCVCLQIYRARSSIQPYGKGSWLVWK